MLHDDDTFTRPQLVWFGVGAGVMALAFAALAGWMAYLSLVSHFRITVLDWIMPVIFGIVAIASGAFCVGSIRDFRNAPRKP